MAQMTKSFAENLLKRVKAGQHINTTCWEEEQLLIGWLYWHEKVYQPRMEALRAQQIYSGDGPEANGLSSSAAHGPTQESK